MSGMGAGMLVMISVPFVQSCLATPLNYFLEYLRAEHRNVMLWLRCFDLLQGLTPLLAAIWAASLSRIKMGSTSLRAAAESVPEKDHTLTEASHLD
jgi:hypothetical protein